VIKENITLHRSETGLSTTLTSFGVRPEGEREATTVAGLVTEPAGRIPQGRDHREDGLR
jgi:hypothetical protein